MTESDAIPPGEPVQVRREAVVLPTYDPMPADTNPMFLERRVYQGSSGKVYPLPFIDRISDQPTDRTWDAIYLENEFLRVMILPEIGGRIHAATDKTNGYDFIYRQDVIKPALVGLAGPWISGGIEFNWPQHHRPATFMPTDVHIESHPDGSKTVWMSDHEPMNRMKGMHGVCLRPGRSFIELKVRLYNRTALTQSFLWWANVATRVHEKYQSFFPPDVYYVADHAKRAMSRFPLCQDQYYGVDYAARGRDGVPRNELPRQFVPDESSAANDLSWYANIPVPTSYMCMGTKQDFFGGYDHAARAGLVHFCSHHISPGKKQWTWGNHEFGYAWDRNLTSPDAEFVSHPYIELMAGVYTDNQPDFSFLAPGETRTFTQYWFPIREIGPANHANREAAVSLSTAKGRVRIGVAVSAEYPQAVISLERKGKPVQSWRADLSPAHPLVEELALKSRECDLRLLVSDSQGRPIISYEPAKTKPGQVPPAATAPPMPEDVASVDELYIIGTHLEQYRHATRSPEPYWREALRRDPLDSRCNTGLGWWHLRRGEFPSAETHFRNAIARLTSRNPNPYDGEAYYGLGIVLRYLHREEDAYAALYKSTWNAAWQSPSFLALAEIDCSRGDWSTADQHLQRSMRMNTDDLKAPNLRAIVLRKLGQDVEASEVLRETLALDPLDWWTQHLQGEPLGCDAQTRLDLSLDFARAGLFAEAQAVLNDTPKESQSGAAPMVLYYQGYFASRQGAHDEANAFWHAAAQASADYCFPSRLEEIEILQAAIKGNPADARAPYYLGNLYYDRRRRVEAIALWKKSAKLDPHFATVWRDLGIAYFNVLHQPDMARAAYDRAVKAAPDSARLFFERDQLQKRLRVAPVRRMAVLERRLDLVQQRDDLSVELCALYNQTGRHKEAAALLASRHFQPWEGGEGQTLGQHVRTYLSLGRQAMANGDPEIARTHFEHALASPENLGEAKHLLANQCDIHYELGDACAAMGDRAAARQHWSAAAEFRGDFQQMSVRAYSELTYYSALALLRLNRKVKAHALLKALQRHAETLLKAPATIDYFATSLPTMLLFDEDLKERQDIAARVMLAQANLGLGKRAAAKKLLGEVLRHDPSHALAADLLAEMRAPRKKK